MLERVMKAWSKLRGRGGERSPPHTHSATELSLCYGAKLPTPLQQPSGVQPLSCLPLQMYLLLLRAHMHMYRHSHTCTDTHEHIGIHTATHRHVCVHTCIRAQTQNKCTCPRIHMYMQDTKHMFICFGRYVCRYVQTRAYTYANTCTCADTQTCACVCTYSCRYTQAPICIHTCMCSVT